jgi:tetratricopeptide (TPR) repeat protein
LCHEYFKLGDTEQAIKWYEQGMSLSKKQKQTTYIIRFKLLKTLFTEKNSEIFEKNFIDGINYFLQGELWNYIEENAFHLANFYSTKKQYKEAVDYYKLAYKAQKKLFEMGALK